MIGYPNISIAFSRYWCANACRYSKYRDADDDYERLLVRNVEDIEGRCV